VAYSFHINIFLWLCLTTRHLLLLEETVKQVEGKSKKTTIKTFILTMHQIEFSCWNKEFFCVLRVKPRRE